MTDCRNPLRHNASRFAPVAAVGLVSAALTLASAPAADAAAVTVRDYGVSAMAGAFAYDPHDRLRLAGDTYELGLFLTRDERVDGYDSDVTQIEMSVISYTCGPHRPSDPAADCDPAGQSYAVLADPRIDLLPGGAARIRGDAPQGRLDVTMTGSDPRPAGDHQWRYAEDTRVEEGSSRSIEYASGVAVGGTLAGVTLTQLPEQREAAHLGTWTSTARVGRGPRVPVPELPAPGRDGSGETRETATADWLRSLPSTGPAGTRDLEAGRASLTRDGRDIAAAYAFHQRCAPGQRVLRYADRQDYRSCAVIRSSVADDPDGTATVDRAAGTARVTALLRRGAGEPTSEVAVTWRGRNPVGFLYRDVTRAVGEASAQVRTRSGIRWPQVTATGTIDGAALGRLDRVSFTVVREWYSQTTAPPLS